MSSTACRYCGGSETAHIPPCPELGGNVDSAKKEWQKGYDRGYNDEVIRSQSLSRYSPCFQLGYRKGKANIDAECDAAFNAQISYERHGGQSSVIDRTLDEHQRNKREHEAFLKQGDHDTHRTDEEKQEDHDTRMRGYGPEGR